MSTRPEVSVVVPVYGCRDCLGELHRRLSNVADSVPGEVEFVFVDDRSADDAWEIIERLAAGDGRVRGLRLSRNFGQHAAITAGLAQADGRWAVVMDCDLQDPPEEIPRLYSKALEGYDIVLARRVRRSDSPARRVLSALYFRLLSTFTGTRVDGEFGSFSIISHKVVESFLRLRDRDRHYLLVLGWLGFERTAIDYEQTPRFSGRSSYSFSRLLGHAAQGLFFQTTVLLQWIVYLGFTVAALGAAGALYLVASRIGGSAYPGWTSLFVGMLVIGGFIIISTGITGLYIGRIFDEARDRPLYVVDATVGDRRVESDRFHSPAQGPVEASALEP